MYQGDNKMMDKNLHIVIYSNQRDEFKAQCAIEGVSMQEKINELIVSFLRKRNSVQKKGK